MRVAGMWAVAMIAAATAAGAQELRPGPPVEYRPMFPERWRAKDHPTRMVPWEGDHVVFLTTTAELDRAVMARIVGRLDGGWKLYADYMGRAPRPHLTLNNKPTIAAVPDSSYTCGVGCGHIGFTGIEVGGFYEWDYPYITQHPEAFSHYFFYEMGRNYYLFEDRHSAFTTGFSVFMRYVCMDALRCEDREADARKKIEAVEAKLAAAGLPFLKAFTTVAGKGGDEYVDLVPGYPSAQKEIYASAMLKLRRDHGGDEWVRRFFRHLWRCPNIPWGPDPQDAALAQGLNWLVAASCAASKDLTPVFADRWKLPVGRRTREALKAVDWTRADVSPPAVLASLPADELPAALKSVLSAFLTPAQQAANRAAAGKAIGLGGNVTLVVDGAEMIARAAADLPAGPFEVRGIRFDYGNRRVTDEFLAALGGLAGLRELGLGGADIGDAGLARLKGAEGLVSLGIDGTRATDAACGTLARLPSLETLTMNGTRVTDQGVETLATMKALKVIWLSGTGVTDAGLRPLSRLPKLEIAQLAGTKVTDKGVAALKKERPGLRVDR